MNAFEHLISAPELANFNREAKPRKPADESPDVSGAALVILDCRAELGNAAAGKLAWDQGHIPGAQHANLETDLAAAPHSQGRAGGGRHPLPKRAELVERCAQWGISHNTQVVTYDDAGGAYAARAWWLLRWLGHRAVAVLDGGIQAWQSLPNSQLSQRPQPMQRGQFEDRAPLTQIATITDVEKAVEQATTSTSDATPVLVDARAQPRFEGKVEPIDPAAGHIPSAQCRAFTDNLAANGRFLSAQELRDRFVSLKPLAADSTDIICYCGSGVTAAHNVLAMCIAGLAEPKLYAGSWSEWCADPSRPQATGA